MNAQNDTPSSPSQKSTNGRSNAAQRQAQAARKVALLRQAFAWSAKVSTSFTAAAALRVFLTPMRHRRPAREAEILSRAIPLVGMEGIAAWSWGRGPTVLLVHGWEGRGAQLGAFVEPLVEAGFRVVAFDAPAHGMSAGSQATLLDFATAIEQVAARVGPLCAMIGHSFGCAAITLAMSRGLTARALVFVAPPARLSEGTQMFTRALGLSPEIQATMRAQIEARVGLPWDALDATHLARGQSTPLLVLHDREDREVSWSAGAELARAWPRATLLSTTGLGHRRILRDAGVVSAAVQLIDALAPDPRGASDLDRELDALLADRRPRVPVRRPRAAPVLGPFSAAG